MKWNTWSRKDILIKFRQQDWCCRSYFEPSDCRVAVNLKAWKPSGCSWWNESNMPTPEDPRLSVNENCFITNIGLAHFDVRLHYHFVTVWNKHQYHRSYDLDPLRSLPVYISLCVPMSSSFHGKHDDCDCGSNQSQKDQMEVYVVCFYPRHPDVRCLQMHRRKFLSATRIHQCYLRWSIVWIKLVSQSPVIQKLFDRIGSWVLPARGDMGYTLHSLHVTPKRSFSVLQDNPDHVAKLDRRKFIFVQALGNSSRHKTHAVLQLVSIYCHY